MDATGESFCERNKDLSNSVLCEYSPSGNYKHKTRIPKIMKMSRNAIISDKMLDRTPTGLRSEEQLVDISKDR